MLACNRLGVKAQSEEAFAKFTSDHHEKLVMAAFGLLTDEALLVRTEAAGALRYGMHWRSWSQISCQESF